MGNTVAKITSKIVELTGNSDTEAFIGKIVTRKPTDSGVVYAIGSTGYVLSPAEYKMFAEAGAIAQASILPKSVKPASKKPKQKATLSVSSAIEEIQGKAKEASKRVAKAKETCELGSEEHRAMISTSDFLMNYPAPSFDMNTPKHLSFFDKKDDFKEKATGWFDKIGKKGRDKLVNAMSD